MTLERNKQTAREFLAASAKHDADRLASLMTDDATYWVQGKPHLFAYAGEKTKAEIYRYMQTPSIFKDGLAQTIGAVTAEQDRVAVEVEVNGIANTGKRYNNTYHYLFIFRDGKIAKVKEYVDTYHAAEIFCGLNPRMPGAELST
ncbi:MAG TPA: nuclear transport factor 2 family protein [Steroidobacteraceae bacterium]|nr:nuclear transport factor 2 family protein [Steroidobacteraceae bacterium]